jgi:sugar lactone lactonase YvrE
MKKLKLLFITALSLSIVVAAVLIVRNNLHEDIDDQNPKTESIASDHEDGGFKALGIFATEVSAASSATIINGSLDTFFGSGDLGNADGRTLDTRFALPEGLCFDRDGNVIVFDTFNSGVKRLSSLESQTILGLNTVADNFGFATPGYLDGARADALFGRPTDGVYNNNGDLFIVDSTNHAIRLLRGSTVYTFAGGTQGSTDGRYGAARFNLPTAIAIDSDGNLYVADTMNHTIRRIDTDGNVTTVAGRAGTSGTADGNGSSARFNEPSGIAVDNDGVIYVADTGNHLIRKIENGNVTTVAGTAGPIPAGEEYSSGGYEDGAAATARFNFPQGLYFSNGVLFIADTGNHVIRALTASGNVTTVAGNGLPGDKDGEQSESMMNKPTAVIYRNGKLYIADSLNNKIKTVSVEVSGGEIG